MGSHLLRDGRVWRSVYDDKISAGVLSGTATAAEVWYGNAGVLEAKLHKLNLCNDVLKLINPPCSVIGTSRGCQLLQRGERLIQNTCQLPISSLHFQRASGRYMARRGRPSSPNGITSVIEALHVSLELAHGVSHGLIYAQLLASLQDAFCGAMEQCLDARLALYKSSGRGKR